MSEDAGAAMVSVLLSDGQVLYRWNDGWCLLEGGREVLGSG